MLHYTCENYSVTVIVDSNKLGPALGGCRIWQYDTDEKAIEDCKRLAYGMTLKNSLCGLDYGGGKAVINLKNPEFRDAALLDLAYMVDFFEGSYITAEDVGVTAEDLEFLRNATDNIASRSKYDASAMTAYGVYMSMKAACKYKYGDDSLSARSVAIQGAGKVGSLLAQHCAKEGADVLISDLYSSKAKAIASVTANVNWVDNDLVHKSRVNIYAPCALGGVLNKDTIPELECEIVCGCANNQLATPTDARHLKDRKILYAPDYLVNAGGVLTILVERHEKYKTLEDLMGRIAKLYDTTLECFKRADNQYITPAFMADEMAKERLNG